MVNLKREGVGLLTKSVRALFTAIFTSEETTEKTGETRKKTELSPIEDLKTEPMKAYWEEDKKYFGDNNQPFIDSYLKGIALERIPDTTEEPVKESHYKYAKFHLFNLPEVLPSTNNVLPSTNNVLPSTNNPITDATEPPKLSSGISSSGRDAGVVAGIVVAVIAGVLILAALIAVVLYKHYVHRNVTSMNFDNPVYRKTTEDQFALEKNGYAPGSKLYPSTVGEEAREPLNTPGTNEYA